MPRSSGNGRSRQATAPADAPDGAKSGPNGETNGSDPLLDDLLEALDALGRGDFSVRLSTRRTGKAAQLGRAFNRVAELNSHLAKDLSRVGRVVGREGRMSERVALDTASGSWAHCVASVNHLIDDLVRPTTEVARVIQA
ncbi:MAG: hypothetical protein QOJ69_1389, partial [Actinomycetota bacterium]|nr:hypothetical protein [Actinomycetota bacterium]